MKKVVGLILVLLLILIGLIIVTGGVNNIMSSAVDISYISAERTFTSWDYTSGNHEEASKIFITYGINSCHGVDDGIITQWVGYDKKGKVVFNETCLDFIFTDSDESYAEFDELDENYKNIDKIKKLELYIYKYIPNENEEGVSDTIKDENFGELLYQGKTEKIIDTPDQHYDVNDIPKPTQHRELTERDIVEMDAEAYGQAEVGDYYFGHDEEGNLKRYKKQDPIFR